LFTLNNELKTNSKNNNFRYLYRGISDFKKGYKCRVTIVEDEKGDMVAHSHSILVEEWIHLLNVSGVNDVRQTEIHITEPLIYQYLLPSKHNY
jgi:hypothetical protein